MTRQACGFLAVLAFVAGGCSMFKKSPQLSVGDFYSNSDQNRPAAARGPNPPERSTVTLAQVPWNPDKTESVRAISPVVQESVSATDMVPPPATQPATQPTTQALARQAVGSSMGTYLTVGGVVAECNGTPIFADKVLASIDKVLEAKARELDADRYKLAAREEINKRVRELVRNELEFAAAQRNTDQEEKTLAELMAAKWRQDQIVQAGGSLELAKRRAAADGFDFDDLVHEQYRSLMTQIYYQKKVFPKIQVRADDMREYYRINQAKLFTEHNRAQFLLIKIDPKNVGGRDAAVDKIKNLHDRAVAGEDFSSLAGSINHDPALLKSKGKVGGDGWIQKGAFTLEKVEAAVWTIQPGEVTDIVEEVNGSFYIAKLESRNIGRVMPFEEEAVQDRIRSTLRREQFTVLREKEQVKLEEDATIRIDGDMMNIALEMAMQKYARYAKS